MNRVYIYNSGEGLYTGSGNFTENSYLLLTMTSWTHPLFDNAEFFLDTRDQWRIDGNPLVVFLSQNVPFAYTPDGKLVWRGLKIPAPSYTYLPLLYDQDFTP
jgi:hypothetical protein